MCKQANMMHHTEAPELNPKIRRQAISFSQYSVHIDSEIGNPTEYRDMIAMLFAAEEGDDITIYLNSPGGQLDTTLAIIEGIKHTQAHVRGVILGACHSAASMLSMYVDELVILDSAHSMIHTASFGCAGATNNIKSQTDFTVKQVEKFLNETYTGFLSAKELTQVKLGVELWFDAEELRTRMLSRVAYLTKLSKANAKKLLKKDE